MGRGATGRSSARLCQAPWDLIVLGVVCLFIATIAFVPFGTSCTDTARPDIPPPGNAIPPSPELSPDTGSGESSCESLSLLQSEGVAMILWIAVPSLVGALLPVVIRHWVASVITAGLFSALVVLGIFSIGILVLPVALAAWLGAACRMQSPSTPRPNSTSARE